MRFQSFPPFSPTLPPVLVCSKWRENWFEVWPLPLRPVPGSEGLVSSAASSRVSVCAAWAAAAAVGWGKAKRRSSCWGSWPEPFPSLLQRRACCRHRCSAAPLNASTAPRYYQETSRGVAVRGGQGVLPSPGLCVSFSLCDGVIGSVSR